MKLRSFVSVAVFFSLGIAFAFAEDPADEDTLRETTYPFGNSTAEEDSKNSPLSFYHAAGDSVLDSSLFEQCIFSESGIGLNGDTVRGKEDETFPASAESSPSAADREPLPGAEEMNGDSATSTIPYASDEDESLLFYDFSLPFQDGVMEKVGFAARDDRKNPLVFYEVIAEAPESVQMTEKETYTFLSFDKKAFTNARNWGHVIFGGSQIDEEKESIVFVIFSSTIMIPVTILSISLSIGLFVVFFTSTGKKENV